MTLYWILSSGEVLVSVLVAIRVFLMPRPRDRGALWIAAGIGLLNVYNLAVALPAVLLGVRTRLLGEVPSLLATCLMLVGFRVWQGTPRGRRAMAGLLAGYVVLWGVSQAVQGLSADFSQLSLPLQAVALVAAAGGTIVARVRTNEGPWTDGPWLWFCSGLMMVYGFGALLDPLMQVTYGVRNDLLNIAFNVRLIGGIAGYLLMIPGTVAARSPTPAPAPA